MTPAHLARLEKFAPHVWHKAPAPMALTVLELVNEFITTGAREADFLKAKGATGRRYARILATGPVTQVCILISDTFDPFKSRPTRLKPAGVLRAIPASAVHSMEWRWRKPRRKG